MTFFNLIAAPTVPIWVSDSFKYFRLVFVCLLIVLSIVLVVSVLMQPSNQEGIGAISGGSDTFFSKNKGRTREGMLKRLTVICAIAMAVIAILYFVSLGIDTNTIKAAPKPDEAAAVLRNLLY